MLKKILITVIIVSTFTSANISAYEDMSIKNVNISRENCLSEIMKLVGVSEEVAYHYTYNVSFFQPPFNDFDDLEKQIDKGYIIVAKYNNIAQGENYDCTNIGYFNPSRNITIRECLAFMLRCLKSPEIIIWYNINVQAVEIGLLKSYEKYNLDSELTYDIFKVLLERMSNMDCRSDLNLAYE